MEKDFLSVGQRVEVEVEQGGKKEKYFSRIEDLTEETLTIGMPLVKGDIVAFQPGDSLKLTAITENALFRFESSVLARKQLGPLPVLVLDRPTSMERVQRRNFYRIKAELEVKFRILSDLNEISYEPYERAISKDISGGGILLLMNRPLSRDTLLEMNISLPLETISAIGRVVVTKTTQRPDKKREIGVEFIVIEEKAREKIIKFIFEKQRKERYKEFKWVERLSS